MSDHASLNRLHVERHLHSSIRSVMVDAVCVNDVLSRFDGKQVDRVYIDAEGEDLSILLDLDFDSHRIPYLQFEFIHIDGTHQWGGKNCHMLAAKLEDLGYQVDLDGCDLVCILKS